MQANAPDLYELTGAYADAADALYAAETDDEFAEALAAFNAIEADLTEKATNLAYALRNLQMLHAARKAFEDSFAAEHKRLKARTCATQSAIDRLKDLVMFAMELAGLERIRTKIGTWYIGTSVSVDVQDPEQVPEEFIRRYTPEVDKDAIRKRFAATGEIIPGTDVIQKRSARLR